MKVNDVSVIFRLSRIASVDAIVVATTYCSHMVAEVLNYDNSSVFWLMSTTCTDDSHARYGEIYEGIINRALNRHKRAK